MTLSIVGINHKTADLQVREQVAFVHSELPVALRNAREQSGIDELVILSTCNRTELIGHSDSGSEDKLLTWLAKNRQIPIDVLRKHCYVLSEKEAVKHLIEVCSGLDAMMFGEAEVFGQVKNSYRIAQECDTVSQTLQHVFEQAFRITKLVRTQTDVNKDPTSVQACVLRLVEQSTPRGDKLNIALIGVSEMTALILERLVERKIHNVCILNRTLTNARSLAEKYKIVAKPLEDLENELLNTDIVISCTGSPDVIVGLDLLRRVVANNKKDKLLLIDLAVPRDIDQSTAQLPGVEYYNIDDVQNIIEQSQQARKAAAMDADTLIVKQLTQYQSPVHASQQSQSLRDYHQQANILRDQETERFLEQIKSGADPEQAIKDLADSLTKKLTHLSSATTRRNNTDNSEELV